jgi:hypothetical protein
VNADVCDVGLREVEDHEEDILIRAAAHVVLDEFPVVANVDAGPVG